MAPLPLPLLLSYLQSFFYCAANLPGNLVVFGLVDRVGRRPLLLGSMLTAAVSALAFAVVATEHHASTALVVSAAMVFNAACTAAWDTVSHYERVALIVAVGAVGVTQGVRVLGGLAGRVREYGVRSGHPTFCGVASIRPNRSTLRRLMS